MTEPYAVSLLELTFIVLAREEPPHDSVSRSALSNIVNDTSRMIGDVNLFFKGSNNEEDFEVEAEVMIAGIRVAPTTQKS